MSNRSSQMGDRFKRYESVSAHSLLSRTPVIIRIDGKAFHTFTKHIIRHDPSCMESPFSKHFRDAMVHTTRMLVHEVQGCTLGYCQSDEISLLLNDWSNLETQAWFDNKLLKICSVSASMATAYFNAYIRQHNDPFIPPAMFDSRAFNVPMNDVRNYFRWRQQDAIRNSVQMAGQFWLSHKAIQGMSNVKVVEALADLGVDMDQQSSPYSQFMLGTTITTGVPIDRDVNTKLDFASSQGETIINDALKFNERDKDE